MLGSRGRDKWVSGLIISPGKAVSSKFGERPSENKVGAREMAQKVKVIVAKPNGLSLSPGIPWWEQRNLWKILLWPPHGYPQANTPSHTSTTHQDREGESGMQPSGFKANAENNRRLLHRLRQENHIMISLILIFTN